ncbi:MAG: hypothetical protein M3Q33_01570 [Acidobacteriota bacterium]|nr:hypothetical protein [Acidobacteriota bacterium]
MTDDEEYDNEAFDDGYNGFSTSAWLLVGITGSVDGVLELTGGRLALTTGERRVFDVPLSQASDVEFPWYYFGGGVKFRIGADSYRLSFVQPNNVAGYPDIGEGRRAGKVWRSLLVART